MAVVRASLLAMLIAWTPMSQPPLPRPWTATRSLSWDDFQGAPNPASKAAAQTVYEIQARAACEGDRQTYSVTVLFLPGESWIRPDQRVPRTLAHEQGHFDLGEVTARRLRAALRTIARPCGTPNAPFTELVGDFQRRDAELQRSYDRQTLFGTDSESQRRWEAQIESWLREEPR